MQAFSRLSNESGYSFNEDAERVRKKASATEVIAAAKNAEPTAAMAFPRGSRLFFSACDSCHSDETSIASLALNTNLHASAPDNLLHAILEGIPAPATSPVRREVDDFGVMAMPAFGRAFDERDLIDLVGYLRARFAPGEPAWNAVADSLSAVRTNHR